MSKKVTKKELANKQESSLSTELGKASDWGLDIEIPQEVLTIPRIMLMQGMSDLVTNGGARMGDFVDSQTDEVLGTAIEKVRKDIEFIPLTMNYFWIKSIINDKGRDEFHSMHPYGPENRGWKWEAQEKDEKTGKMTWFKNTFCLNFFVLLREEAVKPEAIPYAITFKSTSLKNGKAKLASHFAKCQRAMELGTFLPPACSSFHLTGKLDAKGDTKYYVMDVKKGTPTTEEELKSCHYWVKKISSSPEVEVDLAEEKEEPDAPKAQAAPRRNVNKAPAPPKEIVNEAPAPTNEDPGPSEPEASDESHYVAQEAVVI